MKTSSRLFIVLFMGLFLLAGCSQIDKWTLDASQAQLQSAKVQRQLASDMMSTWSLTSGEIQCAVDESVPVAVLRDIQRLDQLVKDAGKWSDEDFRGGCFLGLQLKMTAKQVEQLIDRVLPLITKALGV